VDRPGAAGWRTATASQGVIRGPRPAPQPGCASRTRADRSREPETPGERVPRLRPAPGLRPEALLDLAAASPSSPRSCGTP